MRREFLVVIAIGNDETFTRFTGHGNLELWSIFFIPVDNLCGCEVEVSVAFWPDNDGVRDVGVWRYPVDFGVDFAACVLEVVRLEGVVCDDNVLSSYVSYVVQCVLQTHQKTKLINYVQQSVIQILTLIFQKLFCLEQTNFYFNKYH